MTALTKQDYRGILITLIIGTMMGAIDMSIVNVSLPAMVEDFHSNVQDIGWVVSVYMMGFAVVMPLTQWLKDKRGYFEIYFVSLTVFTLGSFLCGISKSLDFLIFSRAIQALGGGALTPTAMAVISSVYPAKERGRIIGLWGLGMIAGPALGPTLGGVLTEHFGWPSIFLVNIPVGLIGLYYTWKYLRKIEGKSATKIPFDLPGFLCLSVFLIGSLLGLSLLENEGLASKHALILFCLSFVSLVAFVQIELKMKHPLIDMHIFKNVQFVACLFLTLSRSAALFGGTFLIPFLFQNLMHYSETFSGLLMLPGTALVGIIMPFSGKWGDKNGVRGISMTGLFLLSISLFLFSHLDSEPNAPLILIAMVLRGVGLGLLITPLTVATVSSVTPSKVATAASLSSLVQQIGGAFGVSLIAIFHHFVVMYQLTQGKELVHAEETAVQTGFALFSALIFLSIAFGLKLPNKIKHLDPETEAELSHTEI